MKSIAFFILTTVTAIAEPKIELTGLFIAGGVPTIAVDDQETGVSRWMKIGNTFEGYTFSSFDTSQQEATFVKDSQNFVIRLKGATVKEGRFTLTGTFRIGKGATMRVQSADLIIGQKNVFPLDESATLVITPKILPDGSVQYGSTFERRNSDGTSKPISVMSIIANPGQEFGVGTGEYEYKFVPKKA